MIQPIQLILFRNWRFTARNQNKGWSLAEIMVALLMAGVLASIAAPSLAGMLNRARVNDAFNELFNAIREAQANAIQSSRRCSITINTSSSPVTITSSSVINSTTQAPCIASRTLPAGVAVSTNIAPATINFSFKGNTTLSSSGTVVVYWAQQQALQRKCVVISTGVGLVRQGNYNIDPTSSVAANNCITSS